MTDRLAALEAVWDWISRSHANFPGHDHHCRADVRPESECTCGYTAAQQAMFDLDLMDLEADRGTET
jgi:hypothetical protein